MGLLKTLGIFGISDIPKIPNVRIGISRILGIWIIENIRNTWNIGNIRNTRNVRNHGKIGNSSIPNNTNPRNIKKAWNNWED